MLFKRYVEIGRVALINYGPEYGQLVVIVNVVDHNRALVDAPNMVRCQMNFKRLSLTDFKIDIPRVSKKKILVEALETAKIQKKWDASRWGRKLIVQKRRAELSDFDLFKVMVAKIKRGVEVRRELSKLKKGISLKTQELYALVIVTRYLDLFTDYISFYNSVMKIIFISSSLSIVWYIRRHKIVRRTYDKETDTFRHYFLIIPCLILALLFHEKFTLKEEFELADVPSSFKSRTVAATIPSNSGFLKESSEFSRHTPNGEEVDSLANIIPGLSNKVSVDKIAKVNGSPDSSICTLPSTTHPITVAPKVIALSKEQRNLLGRV